MKRSATSDAEFRIVVDLAHAEREAARIAATLDALRRRHDLSRFEYTHLVQIQPAGDTRSHPILTLGTRFADSEDMLLSTYLHEQMHWYLWRLGGPDHDPIAPFFDELVRRYPMAPTSLPDGARNYEQTYLHLVVCWLEIAATAELIGMPRARKVADGPWGYRWIYRTVLDDWEALGELYRTHGIWPMRPPDEIGAAARRPRSRRPSQPPAKITAARRRKRAAAAPPRPRGSPRRSPARGDRSAD
jgi:hypothetical protein